jgi:hypothetical protein
VKIFKRSGRSKSPLVRPPTRCGIHIPDDDVASVCYGDTSDIEKVAEAENEAYGVPMQLINLLEKPDNWRKRSLNNRCEKNGQHYYAKVHQDPTEYRNMYQYLVFRYASPDRLHRATAQLLDWEKDFHNGDYNEVVKCWRLHLGSSEVLKKVLDSVKEPDMGDKLYNNYYLPLKIKLRRWRTTGPNWIQNFFKALYWLYNILFYTVRPFLGASALYFDILKDCTFAYLIYTSLYDMSSDNVLGAEYDFEAALVITLIIAIILVQLAFMALSAVSSPKVFNLCDHVSEKDPKRRIVVSVLCACLGPLMPAIILANYIYYSEQEYSLKRDLQSHGSVEYDLGRDELAEADQILEEDKMDKDDDTVKVSLFRKIQRNRYKAALNRKYYSFYRVIQASIESFCVIITLVLILVVCPRQNRKINLLDGVESKLAEFLDLDGGEGQLSEDASSFLQELDLIRDMAFFTAILYSFIMVISALARYVYQCKNSNMTIAGQCCFSVYIACHLIARMTVSIALFSTAEMPVSAETGAAPVVSLLWATLICIAFFIVQAVAIYAFKYIAIDEFKRAPIEDQLIHVLVNTLVVIPFMTWDAVEPDKNIPETEEHIAMRKRMLKVTGRQTSFSNPEDMYKTNNSFKKGHKRTKSAGPNFAPEENHFAEADLFLLPNFAKMATQKELTDEIVQLWWTNPQIDLTVEAIMEHFKIPKKDRKCHIDTKKETVQEVFDSLCESGYINKTLFNPRRTKMEYFWLLSIQLSLNLLALTVEFVNGGVKTRTGLYYSWDVRLTSFFIGIIFLALYYKKYHVLKNLTRVEICGCGLKYLPIFCCAKKDEPMQAIPECEEVQRCLSDHSLQNGIQENLELVVTNTMQTQTSLVESIASSISKTTKKVVEQPQRKLTKITKL